MRKIHVKEFDEIRQRMAAHLLEGRIFVYTPVYFPDPSQIISFDPKNTVLYSTTTKIAKLFFSENVVNQMPANLQIQLDGYQKLFVALTRNDSFVRDLRRATWPSKMKFGLPVPYSFMERAVGEIRAKVIVAQKTKYDDGVQKLLDENGLQFLSQLKIIGQVNNDGELVDVDQHINRHLYGTHRFTNPLPGPAFDNDGED